jgi:LuxR family maltose regulon positive regulatory protein
MSNFRQITGQTRAVQNEKNDSPPAHASNGLLRTKLVPPAPRAAHVARPALLARLDACLDHKLTLIAAPAGFGKTTLVGQWLAARTEDRGLRTEQVSLSPQSSVLSPRVGWLSLDAADNDPARFWRYVVAACQSFRAGLGQGALPLLEPPRGAPFRPHSLEPALTALLNDLAALDKPAVLVLDDYHAIAEPRIHASLAFVLDGLPPNVHLLLTSRGDPPLPLPRLRARGDLHEIRAANLRFAPDETRAFLASAGASLLTEEAVAQLAARTEGWAAGLRLAALALCGQAEPGGAERVLLGLGGGQRSIAEYLAADVLETQPLAMQTFLLQIAPFGRVNGSLCDAITGRRDGAALLAQAEQAGLFLDTLAGPGEWYRFHALFAEAIGHAARERLPADDIRAYYLRAAGWYAEHGQLPDAIDAALVAGDHERAADLIERVLPADQLAACDEPHRLRGWLDQLPADLLRHRPAICFGYAFVVLQAASQPRAALLIRFEALLALAEKGWRRAGDIPRLGMVFAARALGALWSGRMDTAVRWARQGLAVLPLNDIAWRGFCLGFAGFDELRAGRFDTARQTLLEARACSIAVGNRYATRAHTRMLAEVCAEQGELRQAGELFRQVLADAHGDRDDQAKARLGLAQLAYEQDDLGTAGADAQQVCELAGRAADLPLQVEAELVMARVQAARGEIGAAQQRIAWLLAQVQPRHSPQPYRAVLAHQARLHLLAGNLVAAERWADTRARYAAELLGRQLEQEELLIARLRIAQGDAEGSLAQLTGLNAAAQAGGRLRSTLEILLLMALAHAAGGQPEDAQPPLAEALAQAAAAGYRRVFVDEGEPLAALLRGAMPALRDPGPRAWAQSLLHSFAREQAPVSLSRQERRVLGLLAGGRSNPEIADHLVVSVNTVKTQLKQIYRKLGVASREEARQFASELDLS